MAIYNLNFFGILFRKRFYDETNLINTYEKHFQFTIALFGNTIQCANQ